jgi:hypothetical protein
MKRTIIVSLAILLAGQIAFGEIMTSATESSTDPNLRFVQHIGWEAEYRHGAEILEILADASKDKKKLAIDIFRGEKVAFLGGVAPSGGSNDLLTSGGFYLRVVTPGGEDLRPLSAVWWEVLVKGVIQQVLLENKIIVIEVNKEGWQLRQTG